MAIPMASRSIELLRAGAMQVRDLHPPMSVRVEINPHLVLPGLLLAWVRVSGEGWLGEVVVVDDGQLLVLAIGASALTPR